MPPGNRVGGRGGQISVWLRLRCSKFIGVHSWFNRDFWDQLLCENPKRENRGRGCSGGAADKSGKPFESRREPAQASERAVWGVLVT